MDEQKEVGSTLPKVDFVKWFSELNKDSGNIAGGKGANLAEIYNLKVQVPPGFVVTAQAYDYFIKNAELDDKIKEILDTIDYEDTKNLNKAVEEVRELILKAEFPKDMEKEILESYEDLHVGKQDFQNKTAMDILRTASEDVFVAVRSSATTEDLADASFAGQQDTYLNVRGKTNLIKNIHKCFASLFTARATYYRHKKGFKHEESSIAVIVQKMVDPDKSGVIFSKDPTFKDDNTIIEAVYGLGEGIVSGRITPDRYIISKQGEILDTVLANKKIAITRDSSGDKSVVKLTEQRSKSQTLKNHEIKSLASTALKLEEHYKKPQDIEFAIEGEGIFIVQTRPITTLEKRVHKEGLEEVKGEVILTGIAASPGIGSGKIKVIKNLEDLHKINKGDILVTGMTNPDMVVSMQKAAAIVTDEGGLTAHASIVSREMGIPAVVGTQEATLKLKEGEIITVDGFTGKIYKGKTGESVKKEVLPVEAKTKTKIKVILDLPSFAPRAAKTELKAIGLTRLEGIIAESGKHPEYFKKQNNISDYEEVIFKGINEISKYFDEIWVRTSDIRSDEFQNLEGAPKDIEANPMLGMHGVRYSLENPEILKAELNALKKVSVNNKKIGILLPQVISVEEVSKVKQHLKEIDFQDAKLGVMVETPASIQIIPELCEEGIDFISFGTNDLTQYILAVDRGNEQVQHLYNEMNPAVLKQLSYVIRVCKRNNVETSICGQAGSKKEMVKFLVEEGIDSISVNADMANEISNYVLELETEMIKGTDKEPRQYQPDENENLEKVSHTSNEEENEKSEEEETEEGEKEEPKDEVKQEEVIEEKAEEVAEEIDKAEEEKQEEDESEPLVPEPKTEEEIKEDIEAIEEEKEEYLKEHPEEK
ncbi:phosphoenolpyruvate synthase, partial [Nanoarchaeota archaeon]